MKKDWDNIPLSVWSIVYYKEDDKGNKKFYNFVGDCSNLCEQPLSSRGFSKITI